MSYIPSQGDIVFMNFSPQAGHEQAGKRPALVLSNKNFSKRTSFVIVCPITNTNNAFPLHIPLDSRTKTTGVVLCEQIKSIDFRIRHTNFVEKMPMDITEKVIEYVNTFLD